MEVATLLSGSSGNSIYVGTEETKVLVDAGESGKKITGALEEINIDAKDIKALLVTHEHIDHIKGLGVLSRRYDIPIYASPKTWEKLTGIGKIAEHNKRVYEHGMEIGDLKLEFFKISHDAVQPVGMAFHHKDGHIGIATDTGCVTSGMKKALTGADAIVFEANHDEDMLQNGPYPYHLKKRVKSDKGHLSNVDAGNALAEFISNGTKQAVLAHLSSENNTPEIAFNSVVEVLKEKGLDEEVEMSVAPRYQAHKKVKIKRL